MIIFNINLYTNSIKVTDRLSGLFNQYAISARMFFTDTLCNDMEFDENIGGGSLHLVRKGKLKVYSSQHATFNIEEPSLIFYPSPTKHQFVCDGNVNLTCAIVNLGRGANNFLIKSLPKVLLMALKDAPGLASTLQLLFDEAEQAQCGRQAALDRLFEYLIIQLLRYILDKNPETGGLLAGLNDKRLARAIIAIHDNPSSQWTLAVLAKEAGMSRARFAVHFRETLGMTPHYYLTQWRIGLAQTLLKKGKIISLVANELGYSSASAFTRAFKKHVGQTAKAWLKQIKH